MNKQTIKKNYSSSCPHPIITALDILPNTLASTPSPNIAALHTPSNTTALNTPPNTTYLTSPPITAIPSITTIIINHTCDFYLFINYLYYIYSDRSCD